MFNFIKKQNGTLGTQVLIVTVLLLFSVTTFDYSDIAFTINLSLD